MRKGEIRDVLGARFYESTECCENCNLVPSSPVREGDGVVSDSAGTVPVFHIS